MVSVNASAHAAPEQPANLDSQIFGLLSKPAKVEGIDLDTAYFAGSATRSAAERVLLPAGYRWDAADGSGKARVPLQLCEFLAYKTALAYETAQRIESYLTNCCNGVSRIKLFDSSRDNSNIAGVLADSQGYGFVFERRAYIVFRGTESGKDWAINRLDTLTSELGGTADPRYTSLVMRYGGLLAKLGDPQPGRHVGFSIAWAALKDEVEDWLAIALEQKAIDQIIYSGHSLGGAMAQVAAFDHARIEVGYETDRGIRPTQIGAVVTFGAPAVGNARFVEEYGKLLGDRTVLLESSGDLVPRIMQRWYYRMLYPLRQRIKAGIQMHLQESGTFGKVGTPWSFASEPPLADSDIDNALSGIRMAAQKAAEQLVEREKERQEEAAKKSSAKAPSSPGTDKGEAGASDSKPDTKPSARSEASPTVVYWVVVGVVVLVVAGITWYFIRRKLFSHDIEQRYALYLSTLSYQQLRAKHGGDLDRANQELDEHLRFIRGYVEKSGEISQGKSFFSSIQSLPLKLKVRQDPAFIEYLKQSQTFV